MSDFYFFIFFKHKILWNWNQSCSTLAAVNTSLVACPPAMEHRSLLLHIWAARLCFKGKHSSAFKCAPIAKLPQHQRCGQTLTNMYISLNIQIPVRFFQELIRICMKAKNQAKGLPGFRWWIWTPHYLSTKHRFPLADPDWFSPDLWR